MNSVKNKRIVITGATSGIGKCTTLALLKQGAQLAFCGRSQDKMNALLKEIEKLQPGKFYSKVFDLTDQNEITLFAKEAKEKIGGIDILINCAGLNSARAKVEDINIEDLEYMLKVNLTAPFIMMKAFLKEMKEQKHGLIINVLSTVCLYSNEGIGAYTASKAGLDALTKVLRKEVRKDNIRITSIYPGGVNTPFRTQNRPDYLVPEDISSAIINVITASKNAASDEIVIRPIVETNFS